MLNALVEMRNYTVIAGTPEAMFANVVVTLFFSAVIAVDLYIVAKDYVLAK